MVKTAVGGPEDFQEALAHLTDLVSQEPVDDYVFELVFSDAEKAGLQAIGRGVLSVTEYAQELVSVLDRHPSPNDSIQGSYGLLKEVLDRRVEKKVRVKKTDVNKTDTTKQKS